MTKARAQDIMTPGVEYVDASATVQEAAQILARDEIGSMPVCDPSGKLKGFITDRDIVVKVVAAGMDPAQVLVRELADQTAVVAVNIDDSVDATIETMKLHQVRRVPVLCGDIMVGMISQADIARALPDRAVGDLVTAISS